MKQMLKPLFLSVALLAPAVAFAQQAAPEAAPAEAAETAGGEITSAAAATEAAPAAAPAATVGSIVPPPEGKGQIVFFREKKFAGAAVKYKVREGETELGKLSSGTYFVHVTNPGAHEYTVHSEAKDILNLEVEAGETYYVVGGVTMGFLAGRPNLSPSDQATFEGMADKLKQAKPLD